MSFDPLEQVLHDALDQRDHENLRRRRVAVRVIDSTHVDIGGVRYVNFSSNNYLGLTHHPKVLDSIAEAMRSGGGGSAASPLISGFTEAHASAERAVAKWKGFE